MKKNRSPADAPGFVVSPATPQISAELFKAALFPNLIRHQDVFMKWDGAAYLPVENATVEAQLSAFLGSAFEKGFEKDKDEDGNEVKVPKYFRFNPKKSHISEVYAMLGHACHVPMNTMAPPAWLNDTPDEYKVLNPKNLISFRNGLLDISTRKLYPATPFFFTLTALDIEHDPNAPEPELWLEFCQEVTKDRQQLVDLLQEMLGYLISTDTSMHKVFFLWGRPRSGKGTILRITTALVGKQNTRFPTIETLAGRFGLQGLIGGSVAQVTDMNTQSRADLGTSASRINGISGEDGQTVERKGITDWNGVLPVRFQLAGNTLPNFGSHTGAMAARLLIIPFDESFEGREDRALTDKLIAELPGILNWALAGLDRLRLMGEFEEPDDSKAAKLRLIYLSNPIHGFVEEKCVVKAGAGIDKDVLYAAYVAHCDAVRSPPKALGDFTEQLQQIYPTVKAGRRRIGDKRVHTYVGIRLSDEMAARVYLRDAEREAMLGEVLGDPVVEFKRDANGWPIVRNGGGDFYSAA
jgi:putative DNA primase/helicase